MRILITGANGFLGKNLIERLVKMPDVDILHYSRGTSPLLLERNLSECDFLFHFAAVHRPDDSTEFYKVNDGFFEYVLDKLKESGNYCPVLLTSSIQATDNNDYGRSKRIAEDLLRKHGKRCNSRVIIYRLLNTFGKWARPHSHSVVATFCYNIAHDMPITISNRNIAMRFYYVDDVIDSFVSQISNVALSDKLVSLESSKIYTVTLGELADTLYGFRQADKTGSPVVVDTDFTRRLLATYNSYKN